MPVKGYEDFQSRNNVLNKIIGSLKDVGVNMIGVYGAGGMGKTTLAKEVARKAMEDNLFDEWVIATNTQNPNIKGIQGQIAGQLSLKFEEESESGRTYRLRLRLKQKKVLVILDDLWKGLDLDAVGIPFKDEDTGSKKQEKNEQKICKMLLTSRDLNVLSNEMNSENNFPIDVLPFDEVWKLFKRMAGDNVENPGLRATAIKVAKKCEGFPIAIVTLARALKNKSLPEWKDALQKLERPSASRNVFGLSAPIYNSIKLSYDNLERDELKSTLRLCSLMGQNASIRELLKFGVGLGLFPDVVEVEAVQDRLHSLVQKLKASCLLLDNNANERLAMHDIVRDVAIAIACTNHLVFTKGDVNP